MPEPRSVHVPSMATHAKWAIFRVLELAARIWTAGHSGSLRDRWCPPSADSNVRRGPGSAGGSEDRLWVFASTIGELNAIEPLLKACLADAPTLPLLLLCDHGHYRDAYLAKYPAAEFVCLAGGTKEAPRLVRQFPPRALLIAEIPCMLSDAPCRLSFAIVYELKRRMTPIFVINGWLYHYAPASRMDALERRLFNRDYLRLIDAFLVQTNEVKELLITRGAPPANVAVIGNIKFDGVTRIAWSSDQAKDPALLRSIATSGRQCIVAGCVTNLDDQRAILDIFRMVLVARPQALLVLAPRHPEVRERMEKLELFLRERNLDHVFRSRLVGAQLPNGTQVLVLDTLGELKDFYAIATVTYVGPNHNVLEPLMFDKPVFVKPGWETTYPSYPVYRLLLDNGAIIELNENESLARAWTEFLSDAGSYRSQLQRIDLVLSRQAGATKRALEVLGTKGFAPGT